MGIKGELVDQIFNQIYAYKSLIIEFDNQDETSYILKELNRRVIRTEKILEEIKGEIEENRIRLEWIEKTKKDNNNWPKRATLTLIKKEEIIKSFGFRIISVQEDED